MQPSDAGPLHERGAGRGPTDRAAHSRRWGIAVAYVAIFLALDWASYIRPFEGLNVTPWNPHPALAVALLLWRPGWWWLVWTGLMLAELAVRGAPQDWLVTAAAAAALALAYALIARVIRRRLTATPVLGERNDVIWMCGIVVAGSLVSGIAYLGTLAVGGVGHPGSFLAAVLRFWIGDAVGLLVMLPALLLAMDAAGRADIGAVMRRRDTWLIVAVIAVVLVAVFGSEGVAHFKFSYLLFLPVIWAAARLGLIGAILSAGITQLGLIVAVQTVPHPDLTVFELQALMAAMTMTGLMLGVAVDERARASAELRGSLRMAAAGQMAAALAHELVQPLTALNSYADASRALLAARNVPDAERLARLTDVAQRMGDDALRASDVVKRLRDFFRTGSAQLRRSGLAPLLQDALAGASRRASAIGIRLDCEIAEGLPAVLLDEVQIAVVLRNLLANALDAASASGEPAIRVAARTRADAVLVEVIDSGPGVDSARQRTLFEPGHSDKPGGMGVGLSICRAITEAHGGHLWSEPGPRGHFCLTLPLADPAGERDAP